MLCRTLCSPRQELRYITMKFALAAAASALFASAFADVDPIVIKGSKFFYKTNGTQLCVPTPDYVDSVR